MVEEKTIRLKQRSRILSRTTIGSRIKAARIAAHLSQTELAKKVGTIYQRIHEWESDWKSPSAKYIEKISEAVAVDYEWLKTGDISKEPKFVYDSYSLETEDISEALFRSRGSDLQKSGDYLTMLTSKNLNNTVNILKRLILIECQTKYPDIRDSEKFNLLTNDTQKDFEESWQQLKELLENSKLQ